MGKHVKIRFKNRGVAILFSPSQKIKNITEIEHKRLFFYVLDLIFYGVSNAKTDLRNKSMI